jgi:uncharacterized protein with PhoU and TrkA domain
MDYFEKIRKMLEEGSEKIIKKTDKLVEKVREVGGEGLEVSKEWIAEVSEKTSEVAKITRYKFDLNNLKKNEEIEYKNLGELCKKLSAARKKENLEKPLIDQVTKIDTIKEDIIRKTEEYEELRKSHSDSYVVNKLSDELAEGDATIDQFIISAESSAVNKTLKELVLPKDALISAVKRKDKIIIPDGSTKLLAGDSVTIIGKRNDVEKLIKSFSTKK